VIVRPPIMDTTTLRGTPVLVPRDAQPSLIAIDDLTRAIHDVLGRWFGQRHADSASRVDT
jgi:hypothetical protein